MVRATTRPPRRKLPWILGGALIVVILIVGLSYYFGSRTDVHSNPDETVPPASSTAPAEPAPTNAADPAPTGCLGGDVRDAAMVLAAQKAAPHTSNGAVEFAAAFMRYLYQYPYPAADGAKQVSEAAVSEDAETKDLVAFFAGNPNVSGGLVKDSQDYYRSTIPGVWYLESFSGDEVVVTIGSGVVVDGALDTTMRGSITFTVVWQDAAWKFVSSAGTRTTEDLYSIGTPFTEGC